MGSRLKGLYAYFVLWFYRLAAKGWVPARWFEPNLPEPSQRAARTGPLKLEVVSHCWQYAHFLIYQLSSLVHYPPSGSGLHVTMTVCYSPEDEQTKRLLAFFEQQDVPNVTWNWVPYRKEELFRRGIGRNQAALNTQADWVWFTDCDLMFRDGCFDALAEQLQGRRDALLYPAEERCSELLREDNPMLQQGAGQPSLVDVDDHAFTAHYPSRATGPLQVTHGDVCRAVGYCRSLRLYQTPADRWRKAHEDRAFRWLVRTQGSPIQIPGVYRIRHVQKGRYSGGETHKRLRTALRLLQSWYRERK
ncbi:glycosyltransferase family A protein [Salicola sp. Rm-C-2C1-2]|uniref:glycosyltransferase family A protein n=1 Tax=Salicola sp. Rm-C-2C1-2 TaxID=3141321 RepID=UPI0032E42E4F